MNEADVIVVGAGLSGLAAARRVVGAGRSVIVVEARERVGGRTLSRIIDGQAFDMGAQWIGGGQHRITRLAAELGCATFPTFHAGRKVLELRGRVSRYSGDIPRLHPLALIELHRCLKRLDGAMPDADVDAPGTGPRAVELDAMSVEDYRRRYVHSRSVRGVLDAAVRVVFGAEPSELSMLFFLHYVRTGDGLLNLIEIDGGAQEARFVEGAQGLSLKLAERLGGAVRLGAPVRAIEQSAEGVGVHTDIGLFRGRRAIVAIPPALAGRIEYSPDLPARRDQLTQRFAMGATTKAMLFYDRPFWREAGLSGEIVSDSGPVCVTFDNSGPDGAPWCLLAFLVGRSARDWADRPASARQQAVVEHLTRLFGPRAAHPIRYEEQVWSAERWTRGCPTGGLPPGALTTFGDTLRAPCGRVHWAGTETARAFCGYMEGALEAGERAADEVVEALTDG